MKTTNHFPFPLARKGRAGSVMKPLAALLLCLSAAAGCFAQSAADGDMLYVYMKNNAEAAAYHLDDLDKITFSSKGVQLWNTAWPTEYPYKNLSVISFRKKDAGTPTGLPQTSFGDGGIVIGYQSAQSLVTVVSSAPLDGITVYDLQGQPVATDRNVRRVYALSLQQVPKGVYVVKAHGKKSGATKKIVKP